MASIDQYTATNLIVDLLQVAWTAGAAAAIGSANTPELTQTWIDRSTQGVPTRSDTLPWARITVRHNNSPARSIGGGPGRKYLVERQGIAWVECRVAFEDGTAGPKALALAVVAQNAYEGARTGAIWFPRVNLREYGSEEGKWQRCDVLADFRYIVEAQIKVTP